MSTILIVEGNTPDIIRQGHSAAAAFVRTLLGIAPTTQLRIVAPYGGVVSAASFVDVDGVIFTGSATTWSTDAPEAKPQRDLVERTFDLGLPAWGSCNGMQLAAVVLGGSVGASPSGLEVGVASDVSVTEAGRSHPMMNARSEPYEVPTCHRDEVQRIPEGAMVVATNEHSPIQAMVFEAGGVDFWGTQYHPELSIDDVVTWVNASGIFNEKKPLIPKLRQTATDPLAVRSGELQNWLQHVNMKKALAPHATS